MYLTIPLPDVFNPKPMLPPVGIFKVPLIRLWTALKEARSDNAPCALAVATPVYPPPLLWQEVTPQPCIDAYPFYPPLANRSGPAHEFDASLTQRFPCLQFQPTISLTSKSVCLDSTFSLNDSSFCTFSSSNVIGNVVVLYWLTKASAAKYATLLVNMQFINSRTAACYGKLMDTK